MNFLINLLTHWKRKSKLIESIRYNLRLQLSKEPTDEQVRWCFNDFKQFKKKFKGSLDVDYFGTQMYRKSDFVREESFANNSRFTWRDSINDPRFYPIFDDKRLFYKKFKPFLGREYLECNSQTTYRDFDNFLEKNNGLIFVKNPISYGGKGVHFYQISTEKEKKELFELCINNKLICESPIYQCDEIRSLTLKSCNTCRIITIIDKKGKIHVARAFLRMGIGTAVVDNFSSGGISAMIDVATGIVASTAKGKNGQEFLLHPDTGKQIIGLRIQQWDGYLNFAVQLAQKIPEIRYVGWDIVKDHKGHFCVIEGNRDAGFDLMESNLLYGLKPLFINLANGTV